ncbi:RDD family protein [Marinobacteraceae bacterium S3BR75-40.1]
MPRQLSRFDTTLPPAPLLRRLAAMLYDGLICIALLMVVTMIYTLIHAQIIGPEAYKAMTEAAPGRQDPLLTSILFISLYVFFAYFWTRSGQTLGMQVWHVRIQNADGSRLSWFQALMRFMMGWLSWALVGAGYWWQLFDKQKMTWTDRFSESRTVRVPKPYVKKDGK